MTVKGQVTVPKELRDAFGWRAGDEVEFVREKDGVKILSVKERRRGQDVVERLRQAAWELEPEAQHRPPDGDDTRASPVILVDTNVIVDIWTADPRWGRWSAEALARVAAADVLAVNPIIFAELSVGFATESQLDDALSGAGLRRLPLPYGAAWLAARAFSVYRKRGGRRTAPLPDFFIGAHAEAESLRLLTRDAARIRTYFPKVDVIAPD